MNERDIQQAHDDYLVGLIWEERRPNDDDILAWEAPEQPEDDREGWVYDPDGDWGW